MHCEVVAHSWKYSRLANYFLSSFVIHPPRRHRVTVTVYHSPDDLNTTQLLRYFARQEVPGVTWHWVAQAKGEVCNRAIGRHRSAQHSKADWLWMADCDYAVGDGFLDRLCDLLMDAQHDLIYPRQVLACEQATGAELVAKVRQPLVMGIPEELFVPHRFNRAIGGVQFARGSVCREKGYVRDERMLQPSERGWLRESADREFRVNLGTPGHGVVCPGLFRIRHERSHGRVRNDEEK